MRRLLLLRHAKSDRPPGVSDIDRPLDARGREAAPRMGAYLAREGLRPDLALVSPSRRTRETWEAVATALDAVPFEIVESIYEAPPASLLAAVRAGPDTAGTLILVGHNPGTEALAEMLVADGAPAARKRLAQGFPTAALAVIAFDVAHWSDIGRSGRLERFVRPKDLSPDLTD